MLEPIGLQKFQKKYFSLFSLVSLNMNEFLFDEENPARNVFILKSGEFELSFKKSFIEINDIIKKLGGEPVSQKSSGSDVSEKFLNQKIMTKILIVKAMDIQGLLEIDLFDKYLFNSKAISNCSSAYVIDSKLFKYLKVCEKFEFKYSQTVENKKRIITDRLFQINMSRLSRNRLNNDKKLDDNFTHKINEERKSLPTNKRMFSTIIHKSDLITFKKNTPREKNYLGKSFGELKLIGNNISKNLSRNSNIPNQKFLVISKPTEITPSDINNGLVNTLNIEKELKRMHIRSQSANVIKISKQQKQKNSSKKPIKVVKKNPHSQKYKNEVIYYKKNTIEYIYSNLNKNFRPFSSLNMRTISNKTKLSDTPFLITSCKQYY